jgi:Na+/proline symporter
VVVIDFYNRLWLGRQTGHQRSSAEQRHEVVVSRVATVAFGAAGTLLATNVSRIGSLLEIANKLINAFTGPLFGIYLLAMFSRRATAMPTLVAGVAGSLTSITSRTPRSGSCGRRHSGLAATLIVGAVLTAVSGVQPPQALLLTWRHVTGRRKGIHLGMCGICGELRFDGSPVSGPT